MDYRHLKEDNSFPQTKIREDMALVLEPLEKMN